ncbi:MAG: M20/M25/M40 family metallo-hydrolase [Candidatus Neomarinimicrobiota bacterium]
MDNPADQALIDLFLQLVAINATSRKEKPIADFIRSYLAGADITIEEDSAGEAEGGNCGNLICRYAGGGSVALLAHMDTVRPTADLKAQVLADRITSDGTTILGADNRAGVALILSALKGAAAGQLDLEPFTAVFTICEESTLGGSRRLELPAVIEMAFTFDSSLPPGTFISETYGAMAFTARVIGRASHAGTEPEKGINAIMVAAQAIAALETGRLDKDTTANFGMISGGAATNVVPAQATVDGEVRGRDTGHVEEVIQQIEAAFRNAARSAGAELEFSAEWHFKSYLIKPATPIYRRVKAAIAKTGLEPRAHVTPGGSDANSVNAKGIPAINLATGASNVHSDDEFILLADLLHARDILLALMAR